MPSTNPAEKRFEPMFPQLSGGPRRMRPEDVSRHQRGRLQGAMVEAVARNGFAGTTIREIVGLAGVSKGTFYDHFESKEDCFLSTFDAIVATVTGMVGETYAGDGDAGNRLVAAMRRFMELVGEYPEAASFAIVDSLTLGTAGVAHRERGWEEFQRMARESLSEVWPELGGSETTVRALVSGVTGLVYRRLRSGEAGELPGLIEPVIEWAQSYQPAPNEVVRRGIAAAERPAPPPPVDEGKLDWDEPPNSPHSRSVLTQRERILRGAARVVVERGYESLSIPAISAAAGTSNQTFYENFSSKRDAFLAAYELVAADALRVAHAAFESAEGGPEAIGTGVRALFEQIAAHRTFARLVFFELPTAGPTALDRADKTMDLLLSFLEPGRAPSGIGGPAPRVALEATAAGIWSVIQHEIAQDRGSRLPELAGEVTWLALAPLSHHNA
jgi:AcrR family transcriptional regulator